MSDLSAKEVRALMKRVQSSAKMTVAAAGGSTGACMVFRHRARTMPVCEQMTKEACDIVNSSLPTGAHARFLGVGSKC